MVYSPGLKNAIVFKQENSVSSMFKDANGPTNLVKTSVARRLAVTSGTPFESIIAVWSASEDVKRQ